MLKRWHWILTNFIYYISRAYDRCKARQRFYSTWNKSFEDNHERWIFFVILLNNKSNSLCDVSSRCIDLRVRYIAWSYLNLLHRKQQGGSRYTERIFLFSREICFSKRVFFRNEFTYICNGDTRQIILCRNARTLDLLLSLLA